jgi:hypothetical protein
MTSLLAALFRMWKLSLRPGSFWLTGQAVLSLQKPLLEASLDLQRGCVGITITLAPTEDLERMFQPATFSEGEIHYEASRFVFHARSG